MFNSEHERAPADIAGFELLRQLLAMFLKINHLVRDTFGWPHAILSMSSKDLDQRPLEEY